MLEKLLIHFDVGVVGALYRAVLGLAVVALARLAWAEPTAWRTGLLLLVALFGLKAAAAMGRRVLPATARVRSYWDWRRNLAQYYDSYQWRKMIWVGAGLLAGAAASGAGSGPVGLGIACVLAGTAAEVVWRRKGIDITPRQA